MTSILREVEGKSALSANTLNLALSRYDDGQLYVEATLTTHDGASSWGESLPLIDVLVAAERDAEDRKIESLLLHIHGNEHSEPFKGCQNCARIMAEDPADDE